VTDEQPTTADLLAVAEANEPPDTDWRYNRPKTKAERAIWTMKVGTYAVESGKSQRAVAEHFGMSSGRVNAFLKDFWATVTLPQAEEHRKHEINIVDKMIDAWLPAASSGDEKAAAIVAKFLDRRARLTGSDAPVQVEARVIEETAQERELRQFLEQEERDQKMREAELRERAQ
jgi:hypothetical protein